MVTTVERSYIGHLKDPPRWSPLTQLGVEVDEDDEEQPMVILSQTPVASMVVLTVVAFTPSPTLGDKEREAAVTPFEPVWKLGHPTSILPRTVVLECVWGGFIRASDGILQVLGATDHDWRALECTRSTGTSGT